MIRPLTVLLLVAMLPACAPPALAGESAPPGAVEGFGRAAGVGRVTIARPVMASALALPAADLALDHESPLRLFGRHRAPRKHKPAAEAMALGPERARILLRSLTVPGWGQATLGHRHAATYFAVAEAGVWTAFTAFRVQELMRRLDYERTAKLFAGIDLGGRDDEYRRIVGAFTSSEEYNQYVVARDAANIYLLDPWHPDMVGYREYIASHSISGSNAWHWTDAGNFQRYGAQRKNAQRASLRANTALGVAIANRIVSALHAMRIANRGSVPEKAGTSWRFEVTPSEPGDALAFHAGLRASF